MMYLGSDPVGIANRLEFNPFKYVNSCSNTFYQSTLPEKIIIDFEGNCPSQGFYQMFRACTGVKDIIIKNLIMPDEGLSTEQMFGDNDNMDSITFDNCRIRPKKSNRMFTSGYNGVKSIYGPIDLTVATSTDIFYFARVLQHFELVPNSMSTRQSFNYTGSWDDATLISVANAMDATAGMSADLTKFNSRLQALMGNVDNGLFIKNENGLISLYDFITIVKGWTIA